MYCYVVKAQYKLGYPGGGIFSISIQTKMGTIFKSDLWQV